MANSSYSIISGTTYTAKGNGVIGPIAVIHSLVAVINKPFKVSALGSYDHAGNPITAYQWNGAINSTNAEPPPVTFTSLGQNSFSLQVTSADGTNNITRIIDVVSPFMTVGGALRNDTGGVIEA